MPDTPPRSKKNKRKSPVTIIKTIIDRVVNYFRRLKFWARLRANRATSANILMFCFIIFTSIGAGMIFLPAGLVVAGVACGIFGFLLGLE